MTIIQKSATVAR